MSQEDPNYKKAMATIVKAVDKQMEAIAKIKVLQAEINKFQNSVQVLGISVTEAENAEIQKKAYEYMKEIGRSEQLHECINICASAVKVKFNLN